MATSRFQPRSNCTVRTCRDCDGAGEIEYPQACGSSPDDETRRCEGCDGTGRVSFRDPDVLERLSYQRRFASRWYYADTRRAAFRPVRLPGAAA